MLNKLYVVVLLCCCCLAACGGGGFAQINRLPKDNPGPIQNVNPPLPPGTVPNPPVNPVFNAGMAGQVWTFLDTANNCNTFYTVSRPPASNWFPSNSLTLTITKSDTACYWAGTVPGAFIDFILAPDSTGAYYSPGWVFHVPAPPVWWPCRTSLCAEFVTTTAGNSATAYMFVPPPGLQPGQTITYGPTAYDIYNQENSSDLNFLGGPVHARNQYWMTKFYKVSDPVYGTLTVSEQYEGASLATACGHELGYWHEDDGSGKFVGLVRTESPNDGPPDGSNVAFCAGKAVATINRIQ